MEMEVALQSRGDQSSRARQVEGAWLAHLTPDEERRVRFNGWSLPSPRVGGGHPLFTPKPEPVASQSVLGLQPVAWRRGPP